jgi:hypothetical protein
MSYEVNFLIALFWTVAIETLTILLLLKIFFRSGKFGSVEILYAGVLPSMATLPYVWFVFPYFLANHRLYMLSVESFAVIVESFILSFILKVGLRQASLLSLAANTCSFLFGFLLFP